MRTTATCTVQTGDSPMTLRWLRDGRPLTPAVDLQISQHDSFSSSLILTHVRPSHAGNYTCEAENPARQVRYTAQLLVRGNVALPRDPPPPPPLARERGRGPLSHHRALQPHSTAFFFKSHRFTAPFISPFLPLLTSPSSPSRGRTRSTSTSLACRNQHFISGTEHSLSRFLSPATPGSCTRHLYKAPGIRGWSFAFTLVTPTGAGCACRLAFPS